MVAEQVHRDEGWLVSTHEVRPTFGSLELLQHNLGKEGKPRAELK